MPCVRQHVPCRPCPRLIIRGPLSGACPCFRQGCPRPQWLEDTHMWAPSRKWKAETAHRYSVQLAGLPRGSAKPRASSTGAPSSRSF